MQKIQTLIVDDDSNFRKLVRTYLSANSNIDVIGEACDGMEAIEKANELQPDLILLDIRMPKMNGIEVTQQIKKSMPWIKIIILTFYDLEEYRKAVKTSGASGYVLKKLIVKDLLPTIYKNFIVSVASQV